MRTLYQNVSKNKIKFPANIKISEDLKNILQKMLEIDEKDRYSIFDLRDHVYFKPLNKNSSSDDE